MQLIIEAACLGSDPERPFASLVFCLDDILVGAPLFMEREFESKPKEVGQVYLYLQESASYFRDAQILSGIEVFGRFGSAIAHLGDLNQDGYNDIAIGAPFAGEDRRGKVFIYNGHRNGLNANPSQVLNGAWGSQSMPAGFGFTLRGDSDIDKNDYPDLIVGAFGAGKVAVYRARPVVTVDVQLMLHPMIVNPDNKTCQLPDSMIMVACFTVRVCVAFEGQSISDKIALQAELQLDSLKQKGAVRRTLFFDYHQSHHFFPIVIERQKQLHCRDFVVYLRDETEFRDKLSPISVSLNYSLDESTFVDDLAVKPILNYYQESTVREQAFILVDCGEDNMCIPDLKLSATPDKDQLIIGEENCVMLVINPRNDGEGAYEAELHIKIPPEADYTGVERNHKALRVLSCDYKMENETRMVICDLGNPMVAGTNFSTGIRFSVQHFENADFSIKFELQLKSSNKVNRTSNVVNLQINISAVAQVQIIGQLQTLASEVKIQLYNIGPSAINETLLHVGWPASSREESLLYVLHIQTRGPLQCQTSSAINVLQIKFAIPQDTPELTAFLHNSTIPHYIGRRDVTMVEPRRKSYAKILRNNYQYTLFSNVSFEVKKMPYKVQPTKHPEGSIACSSVDFSGDGSVLHWYKNIYHLGYSKCLLCNPFMGYNTSNTPWIVGSGYFDLSFVEAGLPVPQAPGIPIFRAASALFCSILLPRGLFWIAGICLQGRGNQQARVPEPPPENVSYESNPDSLTPNSPSAPDTALSPPPPQNVNDCKQFQEFFKRVALSQDIPLEEVQETQHKLLRILQPSAPSKIALPINEALLEPADTLWQTPASLLPTCRKAERKYYAPAKDADFLFSHPQMNSLIMDAVTQRTKQPQYQPTPQDKDVKCLDVFRRKVYTSSTLQFRIANYSALLASYDFDYYNKLFEFASYIPEDRRADFKSILSKGQLISKMALQAPLDTADTAARTIATAEVMRRSSWLPASGIPKDLQTKVEDLPFDKDKLFSKKNDELLHTMKDSRVTLRTLGIHPSLPRRQRYQPYQSPWTRQYYWPQPKPYDTNRNRSKRRQNQAEATTSHPSGNK
ncbi:Integrin alpha-8 [Chelonia mydas]|uniref:Integrin alpha-8 n=1 Tax=Chelonia mydas TaxID=8469 RepID=M7BY36_CHEMY|nr:Integrin alpha-8 [Chelonia mydas]